MALGKKIRALREELRVSQTELASCAEMSQGYLSQLENDGVQNPSAGVVFRLSMALHVDPRLLMQAVGYQEVGGQDNANEEGFDAAVDPELLRFLAHLPREQQAHLLRFLQAIERRRAAADIGLEERASRSGRALVTR